MIMALMVLKARCKEIYEKHYKVIRGILKILVSAGIFGLLLSYYSFHPALQQYAVPLVIVLALLCGFIPDTLIMCLAAVLAIIEVSSVSAVAGFGFFAVIAIYFLLFGRYTKSQSYIVILIPVLSLLNLSYAVPVVAAMFLTPAMIPACIVGVFIQYLLEAIGEYYVISQTTVDTGNTMEGLQYIFRTVTNNKEMFIYMLTFAAAFLLVYVIRRGRFNHASHIGILAGVLVCMAGVILGDSIWSVQADVSRLFWGLALTTVIAYIIQFFRMSLDYMGVRKLQFEDDEYFYYVKAVPKMKVTPVDKTVTRIEEGRDEDVMDLKGEIEKVLGEDINPDIK